VSERVAGRPLVVVSVEAEAQACAGASVEVLVGGVGPVAAAAATSARLARGDVGLVVSAGIGGGFAPLAPGSIAVASSIVFADLGAETADGFVPLPSLGFGQVAWEVAPALAVALADCTGGHMGTVLTVATVTGTAATAQSLAERFPDAVAEGMEGAGVAAAATLHGVPFAEVRALSNAVGPRDRAAWQVPLALTALGTAVRGLAEWTP
jgi:futalosine hydrolase